MAGRPTSVKGRCSRRFPDAVRNDVLEGTWSPPVSDGSGRDRAALKRALELFAAAGYELRGTALVERRSGRPFTFELLVTARDEERLALLFVQSLKRAGIAARVRVVDAVQYEGRRLTYDFDMIENRWDQSLSPGNEQAFYWGSAAADQPGTRNYMGVKSPAVDAMIAALLEGGKPQGFRLGGARARPRADLRVLRHPAVSPSRAMDRALEHDQAARGDLALRISSRNLVARAETAVIAGQGPVGLLTRR